MKNSHFFETIAISLLLGAQSCLGALQAGDPAPELQVGSWLQGEPVDQFEGDKVYIVEFWATWCGPCIASIPHINELHERYEDQGLVVIGQNVFERNDALVDPFLKKMAGKMTYRVTMDDKSDGGRGLMAKNWLAAAGKNGIPCAFVINKSGNIVSIGHPMSIKDVTLEELLAEPSTGAAPAPTAAADTATAPGDGALLLASRAKSEILAGNWDKAETSVAELQEILPEKFRDIGGLLNLDLLLARKKNRDALMLAQMMADDFRDTPTVLIAVASRLASPPDADSKLLAAAKKIATPISTKKGQQAEALATLARIAFLQGDKSGAVELQSKAVTRSPKNDRTTAEAVLAAYKDGQLPDTGKN